MPEHRLACLAAALCAGLAFATDAGAAVLIEAEKAGRPLELVVDRTQERVLVKSDEAETLVDLAGGLVYVRDAKGETSRAHAYFRPGYGEPPPYRVELFGPAPMVAGNGSTYYVIYDEERVCAEAMLSAWMRPFVDPAIRALTLLEELARSSPADACAALPFTTYAAAGWPLMSGKVDRPSFVTRAIRFDYDPAPGELAPPTSFRDVPATDLAPLIGLPPF